MACVSLIFVKEYSGFTELVSIRSKLYIFAALADKSSFTVYYDILISPF